MQLFYQSKIEGEFVDLSEVESLHCLRVLRMGVGDNLQLTDGQGKMHLATIHEIVKKTARVKIIETTSNYGKRPYYLHLAIAPTKNSERLEWFLEKATEIGIDEITPLLCEHSERKNFNSERAEKVILAAMKQSLKAYKPMLNALTPINQFLEMPKLVDSKLIAHCQKGEKITIQEAVNSQKKILILIGPEGDFSEVEIKKAEQLGYTSISLGESRLRTETAGILACSAVNLFCH